MSKLARLSQSLAIALAITFLTAASLAWADPPTVDPMTGRVDLNRATLEEILELPVTEELGRAIHRHRTFVKYFDSFFDLSEVDGMTPQVLKTLRPLVSTLPPPAASQAMQRYDASFRQVQQFLSREGASEGLADEYLDLLRDPQDVNQLSLYDLQGYQNVSPVDAVAIINARDQSGGIEGTRQLRGSDGLSYWGYRNLRDYVNYGEDDADTEEELHGDLQILSFNTKNRGGDDSDSGGDLALTGNAAAVLGDFTDLRSVRNFIEDPNPAFLSKLRLRFGPQWKGGIMSYRDVGEQDFDETVKGFAAWRGERKRYGLDRVVVGNFRIALGQGLIMDNTDFYLPRKSGFGFNKRPSGVQGDLSRTRQYALRGVAVEGTAGRFHGLAFLSDDKKDGIFNADGTINRYISIPRFEQSLVENAGPNFTGTIRPDGIEETIIGGNLKFEIIPGTFVGVTGYEARYNELIRPETDLLFEDPGLLQARDSEIFSDYDSTELGKFRRVVGAEFQTVVENFAVQGEYAKLDSNPDESGLSGLFSKAPEAWVVNAYAQYSDLTILGLYRNYDLGFDNPYARPYSEDSRYEQTLAGDPFRMNNPFLSYLEFDTPQHKPEKGFAFSTRYRVNRKLTITGFEFDQWTRVADGQDLRRFTFRAEYAPLFPLRFRVRHRFSSRSEQGIEDVRGFKGWDTRIEARVRLSGFDELRLGYSTTNTEFAPRPRLSRGAEPNSTNSLAQVGSPGRAISGALTHNVNDRFQVQLVTLMYQGFYWNFEDTEFVLLDGTGFRNWISVRSRLSDNLSLRFKLTNDQLKTGFIQARDLDNQPVDPARGEGDNVRDNLTAFRVQMDYTF